MSSDVMTECPNCAEPVLLDDRFCETCGTQLLDDDTVDDRDHREIDVGTVSRRHRPRAACTGATRTR